MIHDYFESAQLYRARFAKFRFRFSQPPIDDSWTKNLIYLDKKENFFMSKLFHNFFHPKHAVQGH